MTIFYSGKGDEIKTALNYQDLEGKPSINGITLDGNKTSAQIGINTNRINAVNTADGVDITINDNTYSIKNGTATDEQVSAWLNAHPDVTTSVQDNSINYDKLSMTSYMEDNVNIPIKILKTSKMFYYYYGATKDSIDETSVKTLCGSNVEYYIIDATNINSFKIRAYRTETVYLSIFVYALNNLEESNYSPSPTSAPNKAYQMAKIGFTDDIVDTLINVDKEYPYIIIGVTQVSNGVNKINPKIKYNGWYTDSTTNPKWYIKFITDEITGNVSITDNYAKNTIGKVSKNYYMGDETEILIAPSDATEGDKNRAHFVCTGKNDELVIQQALNCISKNSGVITLLNGNYYFDSFTQVDDKGKFCIYVEDNNYQRNTIIQGTNSPVRKYGGQSTTSTAIINITSTALDMIDGTEPQACVIGLASLEQRCKYPSYSIGVHKIGFNFADNQHKVICVNGEMFSQMLASDLIFNLNATGGGTDDSSGIPLAKEGFIALRGLVGGNFGNNYLLDNMFAFGFDCAYDLGGEHLIARQLGCRYCNYSYRFNYYGNTGMHPITLINCCDEASRFGPYFSNKGSANSTQSISFYDYNSESHTSGTYAKQKFAYMEEGVNFSGIATYRIVSTSNWKPANISFFENGSGNKYKQINMPFISS